MSGATRSWAESGVASPLPILPLNTNFSYWDHHWIQWTPDHPVYEAIEAALAQPSPAGPPLVRVWLTERAGGKRQVYYFNDESVARNFGQESHFVPAEIRHSGAADAPHSLSLRFADKDGAPIVWEMSFAPSDRLSATGTGLKPQNGHSARSVLLFWYIKPGAITDHSKLTIGGADYSSKASDPLEHGFHAAYDSGAYSVVLPYGPSVTTPLPDGFAASFAGGRRFRRQAGPDGGIRYVAEVPAFLQTSIITLTCGRDGALRSYGHSHSGKLLSIAFDQPIGAPGGSSVFRFAVDGHGIASGIVTLNANPLGGTELKWEFADPPWAKEVGLDSVYAPRPGGGYDMRVAPLH